MSFIKGRVETKYEVRVSRVTAGNPPAFFKWTKEYTMKEFTELLKRVKP